MWTVSVCVERLVALWDVRVTMGGSGSVPTPEQREKSPEPYVWQEGDKVLHYEPFVKAHGPARHRRGYDHEMVLTVDRIDRRRGPIDLATGECVPIEMTEEQQQRPLETLVKGSETRADVDPEPIRVGGLELLGRSDQSMSLVIRDRNHYPHVQWIGCSMCLIQRKDGECIIVLIQRWKRSGRGSYWLKGEFDDTLRDYEAPVVPSTVAADKSTANKKGVTVDNASGPTDAQKAKKDAKSDQVSLEEAFLQFGRPVRASNDLAGLVERMQGGRLPVARDDLPSSSVFVSVPTMYRLGSTVPKSSEEPDIRVGSRIYSIRMSQKNKEAVFRLYNGARSSKVIQFAVPKSGVDWSSRVPSSVFVDAAHLVPGGGRESDVTDTTALLGENGTGRVDHVTPFGRHVSGQLNYMNGAVCEDYLRVLKAYLPGSVSAEDVEHARVCVGRSESIISLRELASTYKFLVESIQPYRRTRPYTDDSESRRIDIVSEPDSVPLFRAIQEHVRNNGTHKKESWFFRRVSKWTNVTIDTVRGEHA